MPVQKRAKEDDQRTANANSGFQVPVLGECLSSRGDLESYTTSMYTRTFPANYPWAYRKRVRRLSVVSARNVFSTLVCCICNTIVLVDFCFVLRRWVQHFFMGWEEAEKWLPFKTNSSRCFDCCLDWSTKMQVKATQFNFLLLINCVTFSKCIHVLNELAFQKETKECAFEEETRSSNWWNEFVVQTSYAQDGSTTFKPKLYW